LSRIGIVVGMLAEAERAAAAAAAAPKGSEPLVFVAGANPARAYHGARDLVRQGAAALLSFGLAGGLDPTLAPGDIVLASAVVLPEGTRVGTDTAWRLGIARALEDRGRAVAAGAIAGADRVIATKAEKAALRLRTGAVAVDTESHAVARAAQEAGVPVLAIRVVLDAASRALPSAALAGLGPDGQSRVLPVLWRLLLKPWQGPALVALGRAQQEALEALGRLAVDLGPAFGFRV
jgi:hopanoid-associated phosphorylase